MNTVYDHLGQVADFICNVLGRNAVDDEGYPFKVTVHYCPKRAAFFNNALWNGLQVLLGDGDDIYFRKSGFAESLEILAHEFGHGIVQETLELQYSFQAGALNESLCDIIGVLTKQCALQHDVNRADWLVGPGVFTSKVNGTAIRSMRDPGTAFDDSVLGKDPQVAHMSQFKSISEDNGGVHIYSGIPNRAFYLAATNIGGNAWEGAGRIWFEVLAHKRRYKMRSNSAFATFSQATIAAAAHLYGPGSAQMQAVADAWKQVGL